MNAGSDLFKNPTFARVNAHDRESSRWWGVLSCTCSCASKCSAVNWVMPGPPRPQQASHPPDDPAGALPTRQVRDTMPLPVRTPGFTENHVVCVILLWKYSSRVLFPCLAVGQPVVSEHERHRGARCKPMHPASRYVRALFRVVAYHYMSHKDDELPTAPRRGDMATWCAASLLPPGGWAGTAVGRIGCSAWSSSRHDSTSGSKAQSHALS